MEAAGGRIERGKRRDRTGLVCSASCLAALQTQFVYFVVVRSTLSLFVHCSLSSICSPHVLSFFFSPKKLLNIKQIGIKLLLSKIPDHVFFCGTCFLHPPPSLPPHLPATLTFPFFTLFSVIIVLLRVNQAPVYFHCSPVLFAARVIPDLICFMSLLYS